MSMPMKYLVSVILLAGLTVAVGCGGAQKQGEEAPRAPAAFVCHATDARVREVVYEGDGVQGKLSVPNCWEANQVRGVLVANPLPPNDRALVLIVAGESSDDTLARAQRLAGISGAEYQDLPPAPPEPPETVVREGRGESTVVGGQARLAYTERVAGERSVVVLSVVDESLSESMREAYRRVMRDLLTSVEVSEARVGDLRIGHARPQDAEAKDAR